MRSAKASSTIRLCMLSEPLLLVYAISTDFSCAAAICLELKLVLSGYCLVIICLIIFGMIEISKFS